MKNRIRTVSVQQSITTLSLVLVCLTFLAVQARASIRQSQESLPLEGRYAISAALGHDQPGYHAQIEGAGLVANNTGQGLTARFGQTGVEIGSGRSTGFTMQPVAWGYGDELVLLPKGMPQAVGNAVTCARGTVGEWYVNGPLGLQQGFTVTQRPAGGSGPLTIALAIEGARAGSVDADGQAVLLTKTDSGVPYHYSGLVVRDADGRQARAWLEAQAGMLRILVDDTGLAYPLYIDPVIQMARLTAADGAENDNFGYSVAISGDTVVVGARNDDINATSNQGSAYVFVKPSNGWAATSAYTAKLTSSDGAVADTFGSCVAISGDTIVAGAPIAAVSTVRKGAVYVFVKPANGWADMTQTAKLAASDGAEGAVFGNAVAISGDTVVAGASHDTIAAQMFQGSAYVFVKPEGGWLDMTQTAKLTASDGEAGDWLGMSVAMSGDTVVAGAAYDDIGATLEQGSAYVFVKPEGGWLDMTQTAKLKASDGAASNLFAWSVAVEGNTIAASAYFARVGFNDLQGSAYVFVKPEGGWLDMTQTAKLTASDGAASDAFGNSVSISGDTIVVGVACDDIDANTDQGSAYVFVKPAGGWIDMTQTTKLTASDGAANDAFGWPAAISGDTVVVGAQFADINGAADQGAAYVFKITAKEPVGQAADVLFYSVSADAMAIQWTPGTGTDSIVLMKAGAPVDAGPADGVEYTASTVFGSGSQIGTGNYVVYSGSGDSVTVKELAAETAYYVAVYAYNTFPPSEAANYLLLQPATASQSTSSVLSAVADGYTTRKNKTLTVAAPGVLVNDTGSNLEAIQVSPPAHGTLTLAPDGSFIYTPDKKFKGSDSFTYKIADGIAESAPATVTITVVSRCPAVRLYGEGSPEVGVLRTFRDDVLEKTAAGELAVNLYYRLAPAAETILDNSPYLRQTAKRITDMLLPSITRRLVR